MPPGFITGLKIAATSPYAFVAYICLVIAWVYVATAQYRLKRLSKVIEHIPAEDRAKLLEKEYNVLPRAGLSAEQWIKSRTHTLFFLAFLALLLAGLMLTTIALTTRKQTMDRSSSRTVDWQMFLYLLKLDISDRQMKTIEIKSCDDEARRKPSLNQPLILPRDSTINLTGAVRLVVDNVFRTHQNMIYPIGLSTTWDHTVYTIYDGRDVQSYRMDVNVKFERDFIAQVTLHTPPTPGTQYILIMSGATMTSRQLFTASVDENETSQSIWSSPFQLLSDKVCGGYLKHGFVHPNGDIENATWPIIAIPVQIQ
jgi:hypothetical protein